MLKSGVFITPNETFSVYEVDCTGFHRIDFMRDKGQFQVDYEKVVYSQVKRKNLFTIGDMAVYDTYLKIMAKIESSPMKIEKKSEWVNGEYVTTTRGNCNKLGYIMESISKNGSVESSTFIGDGYTISMHTLDSLYSVKLDPINFVEYESLTLSKDSVADSTNVVYYSLDVLKRRYNIAHIDDNDFVVADTEELFWERIEMFKKDPYPFRGIDTETTGTDVDKYGSDYMVGVILGHNKTTATYFPFRHDGDFNLPMRLFHELMKVILEFQDRGVAANKKFDRKVFRKEGYNVHVKWDTLPISILINPRLGKGIHGLKQLTFEITGNHFLELDEIFVNSKDINFRVLPKDIVRVYGCPDGSNVLVVLEDLLRKLPKYQMKLATIECLLADVKADQEYYGIRVDVKRFEHQYRNCLYVTDMLLKAFRTLTHEDGNINSTQVLSNLLYNKMHCKVLLRTQTGQASTSMQAIKKLANVRSKKPADNIEDMTDLDGKVIIKGSDLAKSAYPALVILAKYREYNKLLTAFYSRFERTMKTGRIFFWINQNGAATGRQSSPMHQLPAELKEVILSDSDDRDFWGPDYSQIELRMIAYLAGETELIDLAKDPDNDIHRVIGSLISNKEMWAITPEERSVGKRRNFGVVYLISAMGLAGQLYGPGYTKENVEFCKQQLDAFYHRFKRIDRYIKKNALKVQTHGYMTTAWFNRKRWFDEIFDPNLEPSRRASILRMSNNLPVQGTAADYLKLGEVQMDAYIQEKGWDKEMEDGFPMVRMMLSIHDEIIISAHQSIPYEEIIEMITTCMETPVDGAPPFFVQPARMDNWEGHSDDACAMPIRLRDKVIEDYKKTGVSVFKQSYYNVVIPESIKEEIYKSNLTVKQLTGKYYSQVDLVFDHGDFDTEITDAHRKDALKRYIESNFTTYRIDNYILLLDQFRKSNLHKYMYELIDKYGMDYNAVGAHVRHPSLTHELLNIYNKQISYDMAHVDRITEAARLYIEDVKAGKHNVSTFEVDLSEDVKVSDKDSFSQQLEPLVEMDEHGNVVYEDFGDEGDDVYNSWYDDDPDDIIDRTSNKMIYAWELGDVITVDTQGLTNVQINRVLAYLCEREDKNGFYKTYLVYNDKLLPTPYNVENIDVSDLNDRIINMLQEEAAG